MKKSCVCAAIAAVLLPLLSCERVSKPEQKPADMELVDLGLSVLWGSMDLGAKFVGDRGDYFQWGDTQPAEDCTWETYKWGESHAILHKYNSSMSLGTVDNNLILDLEDDAASVILGGNWRMPTAKECQELKNECRWEYCSVTGADGDAYSGFKVWGTKEGYTENWIFIPMSGWKDGEKLYEVSNLGGFWSSTVRYNETGDYEAKTLACDNGGVNVRVGFFARSYGFPIRPVCPKEVPFGNGSAFTVSAGADGIEGTDDDTRVEFSPGNLYYDNILGIWQFYRPQHRLNSIVTVEVSTTWKVTNSDAEIDLFNWSYSDLNSNNATTRESTRKFYDWGNYVGLGKGWRTLSIEEWEYLLKGRNISQKYAECTVDGVWGILIFPDGFAWPSTEGTPVENATSVSSVEFTILEAAGVVFLPGCGYRNGNYGDKACKEALYQSSTPNENSDSHAYHVLFTKGGSLSLGALPKSYAISVRLVRDI